MILSRPYITRKEVEYVNDCLAKSDIGIGKYIDKFENTWAEYNHYRHGISCNSGTNAIYLALKALGVGQGDEVIVPEFTMVATAWAVSYTGATPVFLDCTDNLTMNHKLLKSKITERTKAIIPTAIYGRMPVNELYVISKSNGLLIVEDMAEGHGIQPKGDIACYSFYGNKIITTGEGGMCLTNDKEWADEIRSLANMYFDKDRTLIHHKIGHNFRMTNIQAAIGLAQVENIGEILAKRWEIEFWYNKHLDIKFQMPPREVVWFYDIKVKDAERMKRRLESLNIPSRYFFKPMSQQPMYKAEYEHLNAYKWSLRGLYLPTYIGMTEKDVKLIASEVGDI